MPSETTPSDVFNPFLLWTDIGLRAADMTMASSQRISEGMDRISRAASSAEIAGTAAATDSTPEIRPLSIDFGGASRLYRSLFDFGTQAWLQWMSSLGGLASFATGLRMPEGGGPGAVPFSMAAGFGRPDAGGQHAPATRTRSQPDERRAESGDTGEREPAGLEHAVAAPGPARRRSSAGRGKAKVKTRRARGA
jgi:hypothetical protein